MKNLLYILISFFLINCSFDKKSGIWKNEQSISKKNDNLKNLKTLNTLDDVFDKIIPLEDNFIFSISSPINNPVWIDDYYNHNNNYQNLKFINNNELVLKTKKLTKYETNNFIKYFDNNIITTDEKGTIIIFSVSENEVLSRFNFYKKKLKKISKKLNVILDENIIYVSDNIGYIYAYDYLKNSVIWAKNYKIPFRSNLKISKDKLIAVNQNNNLFFLNKKNGNLIKSIPTEESVVKNKFINNISLSKNSLSFLNTYGSLYSINMDNLNINWFINLNLSLDINPSNLFLSNQVVSAGNRLVVTSNKFIYILNLSNGNIIFKKNFSSDIKPLILNDYLFLVTKNNMLVSIDLRTGKIIYSYAINNEISEFLNIKKREVDVFDLMILNNEIFIFLKNSYILRFDIRGEIIEVFKLPTKIKSKPIIIDGSLLYLDIKNKLSIVN